jgi:murein DD-endopeptidase MepM/ murein hydrolase activator NlpD
MVMRIVLVLLAAAPLLGGPSPAHARYDVGDPGLERSRTAVADLLPRPRPGPARGVWPLRHRPEVVARFDAPAVRWGRGHRGVDLAGEVGQPVRAALPGAIGFVGRIAGRGIVVVDHGATRTTYQPVLATVSRGQRVSAGQVIGRLAGAGSHCAPRACLHWGLRRGETYLDPLTLVDAPRPVRLYPW